jgi:polysaccharide export outer membrane protein
MSVSLIKIGEIEMKAIVFLKGISLIAAGILLVSAVGFGQAKGKYIPNKKPDVAKDAAKGATADKPIPLPAPTVTTDDPPATGAPTAEEDAILPYYANYLREYRLGPSDMISVEVFGQCPEYCKTGITVPPNARISYPLIRDGIMVAGRTVEQVAAEITQKLDEFIIDPKVMVTLDKAVATRYSVMGNVGSPGVRVMDRKVSVYEAILEAGGVSKDGDRKKVAIVSYAANGKLARRVVSLADMEAGKAEMVYLNPGDQVFVMGKGFTLAKVFDILMKASSLRMLAGSPL